jgi:homoserine acetyltransferase
MKQPIYVVTEEALQASLDRARLDFPQRGEQPGSEWGYRNHAEVKSLLRSAKEHFPGKYDLASMASILRNMETSKMGANANRGLIRLLHYLRTNRTTV